MSSRDSLAYWLVFLVRVVAEWLHARKHGGVSGATVPELLPMQGSMSTNAPNKFDDIFEKEGHGLPVPFLRALARRESNMDPRESTGPAWGLMQVGIDKRAGNVLAEYNQRNGTNYSKEDMLNPTLNVRVASSLLRRIVDLYAAEGISPNWSNGNYIGLVVAGWNAGYSIAAGTVKVVRWLRDAGKPVTVANIWKYSQDADATKHLANQQKKRWVDSVVMEYQRQLTPRGRSLSWTPLLLLLLLFRH